MQDVLQRVNFKEETTGSLMKDEYVIVHDTVTIDAAIEYVRGHVKDKKNIHYVYFKNEEEQLTGVVSFRELLSFTGDTAAKEVMQKEIIAFDGNEDQEEAAEVFRDTDFVSIPVTNVAGRIIGVVQVEDILDVMMLEATEDFHKMASVSTKVEGGLMDATMRMIYRRRIPWLVILVFVNIFSGAGIAYFEDVLTANIALVFFLPLLTDSGGNAGSQSATLIIRAMAVGDVKIKDWFKMFMKEFAVSIALGITMALAVSVVGIYRGGFEIAYVVSATMIIIVVVGSLIGMSLPFIFRKMKLDPATASTPLITSICDIAGVLIYFGMASWLLTL